MTKKKQFNTNTQIGYRLQRQFLTQVSFSVITDRDNLYSQHLLALLRAKYWIL